MEDIKKAVSEVIPPIAVILGWVSNLPVVLTVVSTALAIIWYSTQIYDWIKKQGGSGDD